MKFLLLVAVSLAAVSCGVQTSKKVENGVEVSTTSDGNVSEMLEHMERFHKSCEGESMTFRASGERTAIGMWDKKYPSEDVDKAIQLLKDSLLSDADIDTMKHGNLIIKGSRVIE